MATGQHRASMMISLTQQDPKNQKRYYYTTQLTAPQTRAIFTPRPKSANGGHVTPTRWTDRLAFEVALMLEGSGEPLAEIIKNHKIDPVEMAAISNDPVFEKKIDAYREEIRTKGLTFKLKARAQAEELLTTSWELIHHPEVSPAVKADLIKSTVKWGGLEPTKEDAQGGAVGGITISINLGDQPHKLEVQPEFQVIEHKKEDVNA